MTQSFAFISGLPRSGSTLLAALLRQNPRFHASMSSPMASLVSANLQLMSPGSETALLMDEAQKPRLLRGLFDAYYADMEDRLVVDTSRQWCARLPLLQEMFPGAKVIACVRDVSWVMDSLERVIRAQPFQNSRLFPSPKEQATVYSRLESLGRSDQLVGYAWAALKEAFYGEHSGSLLIVEYDYLASAPQKVLPLVYQFLGETWFEGHDYDNVEFDAPEFDAALGLAGLHRVRPKVELIPRKTVLPPDLFQKFQGMDFWKDLSASRASVITAKPVE